MNMVGGHDRWKWWVDVVVRYKRCRLHDTLGCVHDTLSYCVLCFQVSHPRPGQPYPASTLTCWIHKGDGGPSRPVGAVVAALIRRAFDARLLFTVRGDQVAWHGVVLFSGE